MESAEATRGILDVQYSHLAQQTVHDGGLVVLVDGDADHEEMSTRL